MNIFCHLRSKIIVSASEKLARCSGGNSCNCKSFNLLSFLYENKVSERLKNTRLHKQFRGGGNLLHKSCVLLKAKIEM